MMKKRVLTILLSAAMMIGLLPTAAFAAEGKTPTASALTEKDQKTIEELLIKDASISFDPDKQTFVAVEIDATTADNVTRLTNNGLLDEQAMKTAMDWPYYMKVSINSEDVTKTKDFYIYNGETISKGSKEAYKNSTTSMQMVPSEQGKNIIILNKGESCTVAPDSRAFFWGTDKSSANPVPNKYGYECNPAYAAPNPVNTEDFTGRGCSDIQEATTLAFSYEWNLYNWMEIETWFINEQEKSIAFSTDNIPADAASPVDYLIELRDDEGNISRIPVTIYEDYGSEDFVMMEQPGVVHQYAERDNDDLWTEGGVRIPAGYDFRIRALNNDQPIGVYVGGSEQLKSPGWDEEGFRKAAEDLGAGEYIVEEYFMIPKDEIRIEKVATNAPADEEFVFTAMKNYPYYNWVTYEKTETVQMPLNNYPYTLYSSADNTKIGNYKTSDTGNFTLKNGQYAIFKVWKNPDDFLDYKDNGSTYWEGYKKWKEKGDPMPDSSVYTFREQEIPDCVTTVEHVTKDGTNMVKGTYVDNVNNGDSLVFRNAFQDTSAASGSLTISKKATGTGTPDADTLFEFTVTKDKTAAVGQYSVDGGTAQTISADGKISIKAGQSAVLTGLEPGEYTVTETSPTQANYKSTSFSVNNGEVQNGLSATVTVTGAAAAAGGWSKKDGMPIQDADGYFTYTITSDQIDADGKITVDCDLLAEYMESQMRDNQDRSSCDFKVKFVNQTGAPIQYQDYRFDTVNWIPVGETYTPSDSSAMKNQFGYGWGNVWQRVYPFVAGQAETAGSLDVKGFDGNNIRLAISPLRCINPAVISYFDSNPGKTENLTGNTSLNNAGYITLKQMNALPELIKKAFTFKNWEGNEINLEADANRTYADFICAFYGVNSLNDLTIAQKYNVLGTGGKGSPSLQESKYKGQSAITTYYSIVAPMTNRYIPSGDLDGNTLNYFKTWGFGKVSTENDYAYEPDFYIMENDPEVLKMAYDYLYSRCIRFSLDSNDRTVSTAIDNSATSNDGVGGIKDYMDKTDAATANVRKAMNDGAAIADGESITLDNVKGYIEVPNAWNQFRAYDFGFKLMFKGEKKSAETAAVSFTNTYQKSSSPSHGGDKPSLNTKDHYGYIIGYPVDYYTGEPTTDQTKKPVRPEGNITRAEVATIYFRMLTDESRTKFWSQSSPYADVKKEAWFNNAVCTLSNAGIINGYEDGSFRPNGYITRAEFATIAARFFDATYDGKDLFPDIDGHWAKDYINKAADKGFVNGYEDGTFRPDRNITRAEAVTLVNRTLDRHPDQNYFTKDMLVWPDNMDTTKWYYADMQEATNSHKYQMLTKSDKSKYEKWTKTLPIRDWEAFEKAWSDANSSKNPGNVV